jgi:amino acid adenylation domain-containing protein
VEADTNPARLQSTGGQSVFELPVSVDLADTRSRESIVPADVPPNLIPVGCQAITPQMLPLVQLLPEHIDQIVRSVPGGAPNIQDIYPLTPLQEGLLFHHLINDRNDGYILSVLFEVESETRVSELSVALQKVIDRHEILRCAVFWEQLPQPVQVIHRHANLPVEKLPIGPHRAVQDWLKEWMNPGRHRINLRRAPLMRLVIIEESDSQRRYAILQIHHVICDYQSLRGIVAEAMELLSHGGEQLPQAGSFRDFIAQAPAGAQTQVAEQFFRKALADLHEPSVPFGLFDVHADDFHINEARDELDPDLTRALLAQARRHGVSAARLFHAAGGLVVAHTSGLDDIVFGTVLLAERPRNVRAQRRLGLFVNTLPIRLRLEGVSARQLVEQTDRELLGLLEHRQVPLSVAQQCSGLERQAPLFSTLFTYRHSTADDRSEWSSAAGIRVLEMRESWTNYPITITVDDLGDAFRVTVQTDYRVDPGRVLRYLTTATQSLVDALEEAPQTPALSLGILPESERHELLDLFNATQAPYPQQKLVYELFEEQVERTPGAVAVVYEEASLTYAGLNAKANQLARYLREQGVQVGECIPILMPRCPLMLVAQLAALKSGGTYVPLDIGQPVERLALMIRDCGAHHVLADREAWDGLDRSGMQWVDCAALADSIGNFPGSDLGLKLNSLHPAYVMYTSGSTGVPKGVIVPHGAVTRLVINNGYARIDSTDCIAHCSNPAFDASTFEIWGALLNGARLLIVPQAVLLDPNCLAMEFRQQRVTVLFLTVGLFTQYVDALAAVFAELRYLITGGDVVEPGPIGRLVDIGAPQNLLNAYGPTECTTFSTTYLIQSMDEGVKSIPIGRPISNAQMYILNHYWRPVPIGVEGEIYIAGDGVGLGYLNRPQLTAERFIANPFGANPASRLYKTGDLGRWRCDGTIEYRGRNDQQVKIRGFRIELGEIEAQLARYPLVKEVVVLARQDVPNDKRLVAYIIPSDSSLEAQTLRSYLKTVLPDYMIPSAFVTLERWPLTPNGKLDRKVLPAPEFESDVNRDYEAPQGEVEEALAGIWQKLLRLERVGRHDNFFESGGHSLLGIRLMASIEERFTLKASVGTVFHHPTIREMAMVIATTLAQRAQPYSSLPTLWPVVTDIPLQPRGKSDLIPLTFLQRWFWRAAELDEQPSTRLGFRALRLSGPLDYDVLQRTFAALLRRHESLRIRLVKADGVVQQHIEEPQAYELAIFDLSRLGPDERENEIQRLAEQLIVEPYFATAGPLFAARLLKVGPLDHRLIVAMDHIICDSASLQILIDDFCIIYTRIARKLPDLAPMPIQFADYAVWEQRTDVAWIENHNAFWRERLTGAESLQLFTDKQSPGGITERKLAGYPIRFGEALSAAVATFSRQERTTSAMSFLTVFFALLFCWSGKRDIVVVFNTLGRLQRELDTVIGSLAAPLYLRIQMREADTLLELGRRIYAEYATAYSHHDCGRLAARVPAPVFDRNPFFNWIPQQIFCDPTVNPTAAEERGALKIEPYDLQVPLRLRQGLEWRIPEILLILFDEPDGVSGRFQYHTERVPTGIVERFASAYRLLTEKLVKEPQTRVITAWESIGGRLSS